MEVKLSYSTKDSLFLALEDAFSKLNHEGDYYIVSLHPKYGYEDVNRLLRRFCGENYTAFHAVDSFADESIVAGLVVLSLKFKRKGKIRIFYIDDIERENAADKLIDYLSDNKESLHVIIGNLCNYRFGFFIEKISELLDEESSKNVIGGISSGFEVEDEVLTYAFLEDLVIKNGLIVLSFSNFNFSIGTALGFKPYGITYEVKKADGYSILQVDDGIPFSYVAEQIISNLPSKEIKNLWYSPIVLLDEDEKYYSTLRTFKEISKDRVSFYGPIKEGSKFKLSFATPEELLEESERIAREVKSSLNFPELILNFSCVARQYVLEDKQIEELKTYTTKLNAHLFGFFTFGEVGPDIEKKKLKFFNQTSIVAALEEK